MYDYKSPLKNETSSEEDESNVELANPNDLFIAGVDNMLFYGSMKLDLHQVVFIEQGSDGVSFADELLLKINHFQTDGRHELNYYPDVEFRFDSDDEPNDEDLENIYHMYQNLIDDGQC